MPLPTYFCWTRYGTEAGELFTEILARKERERLGNGGVFLWGVGNALGPSIDLLITRADTPYVVFSPIRSPPRAVDASPPSVLRWTSAETLSGKPYEMPPYSAVTSGRATGPSSRGHYALVCFSSSPLALSTMPETIAMSELRNLRTGRPLGASQVTAVVERTRSKAAGPTYAATMVLPLVAPFFIKLTVAEAVQQRAFHF